MKRYLFVALLALLGCKKEYEGDGTFVNLKINGVKYEGPGNGGYNYVKINQKMGAGQYIEISLNTLSGVTFYAEIHCSGDVFNSMPKDTFVLNKTYSWVNSYSFLVDPQKKSLSFSSYADKDSVIITKINNGMAEGSFSGIARALDSKTGLYVIDTITEGSFKYVPVTKKYVQ